MPAINTRRYKLKKKNSLKIKRSPRSTMSHHESDYESSDDEAEATNLADAVRGLRANTVEVIE